MTAAAFPKIRLVVIAVVTLAYWGLLAYQYTHGGVTGHSFLARDDMPEISNWWGAVTVPVVAVFLTGRFQRRLLSHGTDDVAADATMRTGAMAFAGAAVYAAAMAAGFSFGHDEVSSVLFQALPVVGLLLPIYRAEYQLGFIAALSMRFGGVLPLIIGPGVAIVSFVLHVTVRRGITWLLASRKRNSPSAAN